MKSKLAATAARNRRAFHMAINAVANAVYDPAHDSTDKLGIITAINASVLHENNFVRTLTTFATGWKDSEGNLDAENEFFGPSVEAPGELFQYTQFDNAEEFYSEMKDDLRAPRSDFKTVEYTSEKVTAQMHNRGLQMILDKKDVLAKGEQHYVEKLMRRLKRNKLRRKLALLSAGATNTAKTYDGTAGRDPDADIMGELILAANTSGVKPNRVGFGDTAWQKRFLQLSAQEAPALANRSSLTQDGVRALYGVDKLLVSQSRYTSSAAARSEVVGNLILMFHALADADEDDGSNIKDFWCKCETGGERYAVHVWDIGSKMMGIALEHYELITLTSLLGIRKFTVG